MPQEPQITSQQPAAATSQNLLARALDLYVGQEGAASAPEEKVRQFQRSLMFAAVAEAQKDVGARFECECECWTDGETVFPGEPNQRLSRIEAELVRRCALSLLQQAGLLQLLSDQD